MSQEKDLKQARVVFQTLREMLDERDWKYNADEEKLEIISGARGEDLPIDLCIRVDAKRQIVMLLSQLSFRVPKEKRVETALAISAINYALVDGSFDYDISDGTMIFRMTSSFRESLLGKDLFEYMLYISCRTVDDYNDKLLDFCKDKLSLQDLIKSINE